MDPKTLDTINKLVNRATSENAPEAESAVRGALGRMKKHGVAFEDYLESLDPDEVFQYGVVRVADKYVQERDDLSIPKKRDLYAKILARISARYSGDPQRADPAKVAEEILRQAREASEREKREESKRRAEEAAAKARADEPPPRRERPRPETAKPEPATEGPGPVFSGSAHWDCPLRERIRRATLETWRQGGPARKASARGWIDRALLAVDVVGVPLALRAYGAAILFGAFSGTLLTLALGFAAYAADWYPDRDFMTLSPWTYVAAIGAYNAVLRVRQFFS